MGLQKPFNPLDLKKADIAQRRQQKQQKDSNNNTDPWAIHLGPGEGVGVTGTTTPTAGVLSLRNFPPS